MHNRKVGSYRGGSGSAAASWSSSSGPRGADRPRRRANGARCSRATRRGPRSAYSTNAAYGYEGTLRCPLRGETRPRVVVRERASRAPSKSTSTGPPPRATKLADRASVTRNRRNTQVLRAEQKQLTPSVSKKQQNPLESVAERPGEAGRACTAPGRRRARGGRSADSNDRVPACRPNPLNCAGAASAVSGPCPPTGFSGSRAGPARWTLKTVCAEAAVLYVED